MSTSLESQEAHTARQARLLHESVLKRVVASEAEATMSELKTATLMRAVETEALEQLQQMERMAAYDMDEGVRVQLEAAQRSQTDASDDNVRKLVFDNLYADVVGDCKAYNERLNFEQNPQNASLYFRPAAEEEPGPDSDDDEQQDPSASAAASPAHQQEEAKKSVFSFLF
jgi:hypothetical protein